MARRLFIVIVMREKTFGFSRSGRAGADRLSGGVVCGGRRARRINKRYTSRTAARYRDSTDTIA